MSTLTATQVACYAQKAGFVGPLVLIMVSVSKLESNFRTDARNFIEVCTGSECGHATGLWQIVDFPSRKHKYGDLTDPQTNARAAYDIYHAEGTGAWTTWKQAAIAAPQYSDVVNALQPGQCASEVKPTPGRGPKLPSIPNIGSVLTSGVHFFGDTLIYNAVAVLGMLLLGSGVLAIGFTFTHKTAAASKFVSAVKTAALVVK